MPNIQSAIKRVRQTEKRTARNRVRKERLKQTLKAFNRAVETGDNAKATEIFKKQAILWTKQVIKVLCIKMLLTVKSHNLPKTKHNKCLISFLAFSKTSL